MTKLSIDKGIPVPTEAVGRRRLLDYPFGRMEIGDSFTVRPEDAFKGDDPVFTPTQLASLNRLYYAVKRAVSRYTKQNPRFDFTVTSGQENQTMIVRCWRVQ